MFSSIFFSNPLCDQLCAINVYRVIKEARQISPLPNPFRMGTGLPNKLISKPMNYSLI